MQDKTRRGLNKHAELLFQYIVQCIREVLGKIPFEVSADPFYSESNMVHLRRGADAPGAGKGAEHDIIEADE